MQLICMVCMQLMKAYVTYFLHSVVDCFCYVIAHGFKQSTAPMLIWVCSKACMVQRHIHMQILPNNAKRDIKVAIAVMSAQPLGSSLST